VPPPGGDEPLPRQTLPAFAVALTFITLGAFFVGSAIRRYILQPADLPDGIANPGSKAKRRGGSGGGKGGRGAGPSVPSVRDLLAQHGQTAEAPGSADPAPPLAAADASQVQTAAAVAAAAGAPSAQGAAAAAAAEAEAAAGPASASEAGTAVETLAGAVPPAAAEQAASGEGEGEGGAIPAEEWCSSILEPALQAATAAKRAEQEEAAAAAAAAKAAALQEAEAVAAAARLAADRQAAAAAAAPLLGAGEVWALSQQGPDGAVLLRLLFPVPGGGEERCVALFQVRPPPPPLAQLAGVTAAWGLGWGGWVAGGVLLPPVSRLPGSLAGPSPKELGCQRMSQAFKQPAAADKHAHCWVGF
jgi:hypothetical protein